MRILVVTPSLPFAFGTADVARRERTVTYLHHLEVIDREQRTDLDRRERITRWQMERATNTVLSKSKRELIETLFGPKAGIDRLEVAYEQLGLLTPARKATS